jgi:hypothetical protein
VREAFREVPAIAERRLADGRTIRDALDQQPVLTFERDAAGRFQRLGAINPAGQALLDSAAGPGLNRIFGVAHDHLEPAVRDALQGVRLSADAAQFGLSWTIGMFEAERAYGHPLPVPGRDVSPADTQRWIEDGQQFASSLATAPPSVVIDTAVAGAWTAMGPRSSRALIDTALGTADPTRATSVVALLLHEFEHMRSPSAPQQWRDGYLDGPFEQRMNEPVMDQVAQIASRNWLEEATATVLSQWPGRIPAAMREMGLGEHTSPQDVDYEHATTGLRTLLGLAGIDAADPEQHHRADALLQQRDLARVPAALAKAIAGQHRLPEQLLPELTDRIENASTKLEILTNPQLIEQRIQGIVDLVGRDAK